MGLSRKELTPLSVTMTLEEDMNYFFIYPKIFRLMKLLMKPLKLLMISGSVLIPLLFLLGGSYISEPGRLPNGSQRTVQTRAVESASLKVEKSLKIGNIGRNRIKIG